MKNYKINPYILAVIMVVSELLLNVLFGLQLVASYAIPALAGLYFGLVSVEFPSVALLVGVLKDFYCLCIHQFSVCASSRYNSKFTWDPFIF